MSRESGSRDEHQSAPVGLRATKSTRQRRDEQCRVGYCQETLEVDHGDPHLIGSAGTRRPQDAIPIDAKGFDLTLVGSMRRDSEATTLA